MDRHTRDIIAYKISNKMDREIVLDTLNDAIAK